MDKLRNIVAYHGVHRVAKDMGIHWTTPYKWLRGERRPNVLHAKMLCRLYGLEMADLRPDFYL
jgi:DNA-binding phage protein